VYTHGHHESVLRSHRWRTAENSAGYLLPHLRPGLSLLDVGCGPGTITVDLARCVAPGRVTAVEVSQDVLALTRAYAAEQHREGIDFVVADVHALDLPDDSFDIVHAHQVLQHVADPVRALTEMRRVGRPGGVVAARDGDYAGVTWYPRVPELDEWLDLYRRAARANGSEPRRRTPAAVLGSGGRVRRRDRLGQRVVLRDAGGPRILGWHVGRADRPLRHRAATGRPPDGVHCGPPTDLGRVAGVGGVTRRMVRGAERRDSL
jgi:SAM-dependent methyltransferase